MLLVADGVGQREVSLEWPYLLPAIVQFLLFFLRIFCEVLGIKNVPQIIAIPSRASSQRQLNRNPIMPLK
jgi:hypothetical protein